MTWGLLSPDMKVGSKSEDESKQGFFTARLTQGCQERKEQRKGSYSFPVGYSDWEKLKPFASLAAFAVQLLSFWALSLEHSVLSYYHSKLRYNQP